MLQEQKMQQQSLSNRIEELQTRLKKVMDFSRDNTKELIQAKKAYNVADRHAREERARLIHELDSFRSQLTREKTRNDDIEKVNITNFN